MARWWAGILAAAAAGMLGVGAASAADPRAGQAKAEACSACHGPGGISVKEATPSLAGQPEPFLQWQLVFFRAEVRKNEPMAALVANLSDEDIRDLAAYYAAQRPAPPPDEVDDRPALTEAGARLAAQNRCGNCHAADYGGQQAAARLAHQREDYLLKALRDYKAGRRTGGGVAAMPSAVAGLSDEDLQALAHFLARRP